ncbi:MAG: hypothetical protein EB027_06620, partial [Actinobacteria bacterium]|nr:hypothetical protein [Actinomycetota bacterium]
EIERLSEDSLRVSARFHIEDLAEELDIELDADEEGVDTVAGLLARRLGVVPIPGAHIEVAGWRLTAEAAGGRRNQVTRVLVERVSQLTYEHAE